MQEMTCLIIQNIFVFTILLFILLPIYALSLQVDCSDSGDWNCLLD